MPASFHLLIVEDHDLLRDELVFLLEAPHREIAQADSAEAALALCDARAFDVVVTDVGLPGRSGLDLARELLARRPQQPVILCTGHRLETVADVLALGPNVRALFKDQIEQALPALVSSFEADRPAG